MPNSCLRCKHGDDQNRQQVFHGCSSASHIYSNVEAGKSLPAGAAHSMRASAQVTAPGAVTSMIVAVSTRPSRQNRSTCSRMSVASVQIQILGLVNRFSHLAWIPAALQTQDVACPRV